MEQTKTKPQEILEFKMNKQVQTFSFNPSKNLLEEGKWLLGLSLLECTNSVFDITNETNRFQSLYQVTIKTYLMKKTIDNLNKILELKSLELHVEEVRKIGKK